MSTFTVEHDDLDAYLKAGRPLDPIIEKAREVIEDGGKFVIKDAIAPGHDAEITSHEDLDSLLRQLDPVKLLPEDEDRFFLFQGKQLICEVYDIDISGGRREVEVIPTMGGQIRSLGRTTPTKVKFTCNQLLSLEWTKPYTLLNYEYKGVTFIVEKIAHENGKTKVVGIKTEN